MCRCGSVPGTPAPTPALNEDLLRCGRQWRDHQLGHPHPWTRSSAWRGMPSQADSGRIVSRESPSLNDGSSALRSANAHQDDEIVQSLFLGAELTANIAIWKQAIR